MNNSQEMIALTWYKGGKNSPWVLSLEDSTDEIYEVTIGETGRTSIGRRLEVALDHLESKIYRYPFKYDMRQVRNHPARLFSGRILKDKVVYIESPLEFEKEVQKGVIQKPFAPLEDTVGFMKESSYFQSAVTENKIMTLSTMRAVQETENYQIIDNNMPNFKDSETNHTAPYSHYPSLDSYGRVGTVHAMLSYEMMPDEERGKINHVIPTGWKQTTYNNIKDNWLYHRSHLIAYQLTGQNDNERNLMTGTAHFNEVMSEIEHEIATYIRNTKNHVLYRVTPDFKGSNLVASGITLEAYSIEDKGKGIKYHIYIPNIQPGIEIDYRTGASKGTTQKEITLLEEYAPNSNMFWVFVDPQNVQVIDSSTIEVYIDAYNWPEGYQVPENIGAQNILDSQRTVRVDLLGMKSFSEESALNLNSAKQYKVFKNKKDKETGKETTYYDPSIFVGVEKEAQSYLEELIKTQGILALSLQYSTTNSLPVPNAKNLLSVAYGTSFNNLTEVENAISGGNFRGVNINKSLLKEYYSKNGDVQRTYKDALDIPLVEYLNQSEGYGDHGINPSFWIEEAGIQLPPSQGATITDQSETQEEVIERIIEDIVRDEANLNSSDHYIEGYINNDLAFVPANDDRLMSGELYDTFDESTFEGIPENEQAGVLPYDYTHKVRIGDVMLEIPPLSIRATKQQANEHVSTLRSRNAMHKGVGTNRQTLTLDLYFHDLENINGHKRYAYTKENGRQVFYYMDGLRTLLAQFIKSPFVPIDNEYINDSLGVRNVAMQNIQAQTVEGFPEALMVSLTLEDFDVSPYLMGETDLGMAMNYPLYRWYYQQSLQEPESNFSTKTYLPEVERLDNLFHFQIASEAYLNHRTDIINEFNALDTPGELKRKLEEEAKTDTSKFDLNEREDSDSAQKAIEMYKKYVEYYNKLSPETKSKYKISELPIIRNIDAKNVKNGQLQTIPKDEYGLAVEVSKHVYGEPFMNEDLENYFKQNNSLFHGGYEAGDDLVSQLVKEYDLPGTIRIKVKSQSEALKLREMVKEAREWAREEGFDGEYRNKISPYSTSGHNAQIPNLYVVPAGKVGNIDFMAHLGLIESKSNLSKEINEEVEQYTIEYNRMVNEINIAESDIPMDDFYIDDLIPLDLSVSISNNLSLVQVQAAQTPSFQYLGAQQPEVQITFSTTNEGVQQIDALFRQVARYAKEYRTGLVSNFMTIKNPMVNMFGIQAVLPNTFDITTVEGQPDQKIVTMILTGFDRTQRRQEALYSFAGGKVTKEMKELHLDNYDPQVNSLFVHEKMKYMELYPDLELPTYNELEEALPHLDTGINEFENRAGQVYLDPDFYISTETTVRKKLAEILGDSRGAPVQVKDTTEGSGETNVLNNQGLIVNDEVQEMINADDENYVDPYFKWMDYEGSSTTTVEGESLNEDEDGDKLTLEDNNIIVKSGNGDVKSVNNDIQDIITSYGKDTGKNPNLEEVWEYLFNEIERIFGNYPEYYASDLSGYNELAIAGDSHLFKRFSRKPDAAFLNDYPALAIKSNWLKNGVKEELGFLDKAGLLFSHDTIESGRSKGEPVQQTRMYVDHKANGHSYYLPELLQIRLFMYAKTIIESESNWQQFDQEGKPFITMADAKGKPLKVGIMGAPLAGTSKTEARKLATNWKHNITYSLNKMNETYAKARNNKYGDIHGRAMDWAVFGHGGAELPRIIHTNSANDDVLYSKEKLVITPESSRYFTNFSSYYGRTAKSIANGNVIPIFSARDEVFDKKMTKVMGITEEETHAFLDEAFEQESNNFDQYTLEDKIRLMYVDMQQHNHVGRFVRAFPSFSLMLIDEGKWFQNFRTWDNFYGYNALHSIDVYKSRKVAADTAVISMSNMYGNLSSSHGSQSHPDLKMPHFYSSQFFEQYILGRPTEQQIEQRAEQYDQIMLQTGARVHLRMGYGADASYLPVVFNGSIAEISTDEVVEIVAQSDALELQNVISGDPGDDNVGFMNRVQEPRRTIGELMTTKGNWIREMVNEHTNSTFFKNSPMGIVHFGSTIQSEKGNRAILPGAHKEEFGESLQNVYSQNGMETKSQWHYRDGSTVAGMEMAADFTKELLTNIAVLLGSTPPFDEDNIAVSYYGRTVWDIIQTFALASQDYIAEVVPFEFRSTLFFGKPHWVMQYRYDSDFIYDSDREKIDRTITKAHVKTFMQAHVYNSKYNIINNNIMASEDGVYNNVIVTYDGRQAGPVQADSDIRFDKQRTIDVEANILAPRLIEYFRAEDQALIYGQSTLRDFMKDMYKGEYSVIGDPTVKPYDVVYMNDHINDVNGIHMVKAVHHSMDGEHGLVSYIEPDAYVYNFDEELGELSTGLFSIGKNLNISVEALALKTGLSWMTTAVISKLLGKAIEWGTPKAVAAVNSKIGVGIIKYSSGKLFESAGSFFNAGGTTVTLAKGMKSAKNLTELNHLVSTANASLQADILRFQAKGAAKQATFFQKRANAIQSFLEGPKTAANLKKASASAKTAGQTIKGLATSKAFLFAVSYTLFNIATATISEWWSRKKQNAEAIKVIPLIHRGRRWTALMNWHKGSVLGDDPSLRDKLMNAEFFDKDIDPEVNEVFGKTIFKLMNFFFD